MKVRALLAAMALCLAGAGLPAQETADAATTATTAVRRAPWRAIPLAESRIVAQEPRRVESLDRLVQQAIEQALEEAEHKTTTADTVWGTIIDCSDTRDPRMGSYHGNEKVYPASVVKTCYMVTAFDQHRLGLIDMDEALREDLVKMIGPSNNAATNRILDRLANTSAGEELEGEALESFQYKRHVVYRHMQQLGLDGLYPVNKTYDNSIRLYGREMQFLGNRVGGNYERSNKMTTDDTARLLYLIWRHAVVDYDACEAMLDLMKRGEDRPRTFFSSIAPEGWQHYAKDGSTGVQRHEAAIFVRPDGATFIIVLFSNHSNVQNNQYGRVIQRAGELILQQFAATPGEPDSMQ